METREKNALLIAEIEQHISNLENDNLLKLRHYFRANCITDGENYYNDDMIIRMFLNNKTKRFPLRVRVEDVCKYYLETINGIEQLCCDTASINMFCPLENADEIRTNLERFGFPSHGLERDCDWGYGRLEGVKYDIFNSYVVNGGVSARSYYFYGYIGSGKTTLLCNIAKRIYSYLEIRPRYITLSRLAGLFTASSIYENKYAQNKAFEELDALQYSSILFVDNISFAQMTDKQAEHCIDFFYNRYTRRLPVFLASNDKITASSPFLMQLSSWMKDSDYFAPATFFDWEDRRK